MRGGNQNWADLTAKMKVTPTAIARTGAPGDRPDRRGLTGSNPLTKKPKGSSTH